MKYEKMLDNIYKAIPEKVKTKERFEIPKFSSYISGKQTVINNLADVSKQLRREQSHLMKFLMKELAVPGVIKAKKGVLQGKFKQDMLNSLLEKYIKEFVQCNECGKHDTELITFEGATYKRCEVCGARAPVRKL